MKRCVRLGCKFILCLIASAAFSASDTQVVFGQDKTAANDPSAELVVPQFAQDVTLHVVLHELGHAVIREFDVPVLGNEETVADAFATYFLTTYFPDRAPAVLEARVKSLMIEAAEVPRVEWTVQGEHNNDARRAYQIAAVAVASDAKKYAKVAQLAGMSERQIRSSADYGSEIHRSWRRTLKPLWMPSGVQSSECRLRLDPSCPVVAALKKSGVTHEILSAASRFDWHSQVTLQFVEGDGGAAWNRSKRSITVKSEYVRRFIRQAAVAQSSN